MRIKQGSVCKVLGGGLGLYRVENIIPFLKNKINTDMEGCLKYMKSQMK